MLRMIVGDFTINKNGYIVLHCPARKSELTITHHMFSRFFFRVCNWVSLIELILMLGAMEHGLYGFIDRDEAKETTTAFCCETAPTDPNGKPPKSSKPHSNSTCGVQD